MFESLTEGLSGIGAAAGQAVQQARQAAAGAAQQAASAAQGAIAEAQAAVANATTAATGAASGAVAQAQQAAQAAARPHLDVARGEGGGDHRVHDRAPGLVALHAGDACPAVGGFQALGEAAVRRPVEGRAEVGQPTHRGGALLGQQPGDLGDDQARAGGHRVGGVQGRGVVGRQRGRHPALGPGR